VDLQLTRSRDGSKTETLLHALEAQHTFCSYICVDVSRNALERAIAQLQSQKFEYVCVSAIWGTIEMAKEYIRAVPTQRVIWAMGSTISISQAFSADVVLSFRRLLRENDMMIVGQDCNTDINKMAAAFSSQQFDPFIEGGFQSCDRLLGLSGPWKERWSLRKQWMQDKTSIRHVCVFTARINIPWSGGYFAEGDQMTYFTSRRYLVDYVSECFRLGGLSTVARRIGNGGSCK
jgi:uncharacterized SAM-dependent methyltransferase